MGAPKNADDGAGWSYGRQETRRFGSPASGIIRSFDRVNAPDGRPTSTGDVALDAEYTRQQAQLRPLARAIDRMASDRDPANAARNEAAVRQLITQNGGPDQNILLVGAQQFTFSDRVVEIPGGAPVTFGRIADNMMRNAGIDDDSRRQLLESAATEAPLRGADAITRTNEAPDRAAASAPNEAEQRAGLQHIGRAMIALRDAPEAERQQHAERIIQGVEELFGGRDSIQLHPRLNASGRPEMASTESLLQGMARLANLPRGLNTYVQEAGRGRIAPSPAALTEIALAPTVISGMQADAPAPAARNPDAPQTTTPPPGTTSAPPAPGAPTTGENAPAPRYTRGSERAPAVELARNLQQSQVGTTQQLLIAAGLSVGSRSTPETPDEKWGPTSQRSFDQLCREASPAIDPRTFDFSDPQHLEQLAAASRARAATRTQAAGQDRAQGTGQDTPAQTAQVAALREQLTRELGQATGNDIRSAETFLDGQSAENKQGLVVNGRWEAGDQGALDRTFAALSRNPEGMAQLQGLVQTLRATNAGATQTVANDDPPQGNRVVADASQARSNLGDRALG